MPSPTTGTQLTSIHSLISNTTPTSFLANRLFPAPRPWSSFVKVISLPRTKCFTFQSNHNSLAKFCSSLSSQDTAELALWLVGEKVICQACWSLSASDSFRSLFQLTNEQVERRGWRQERKVCSKEMYYSEFRNFISFSNNFLRQR